MVAIINVNSFLPSLKMTKNQICSFRNWHRENLWNKTVKLNDKIQFFIKSFNFVFKFVNLCAVYRTLRKIFLVGSELLLFIATQDSSSVYHRFGRVGFELGIYHWYHCFPTPYTTLTRDYHWFSCFFWHRKGFELRIIIDITV